MQGDDQYGYMENDDNEYNREGYGSPEPAGGNMPYPGTDPAANYFATDHVAEPPGTYSRKEGIILLVFAIVGIIVFFAVPWLYTEDESLWYHELDDEINDDLKDVASGALWGFVLLLVLGIVLLIEASSGSLYRGIANGLSPGLRSQPKHKVFLLIMVRMVVVIFALIVVRAGTKFVGFVRNIEDNFIDGEAVSFAGWIVFGMGLALLVRELYCIKVSLSEFISADTNKFRKTLYNHSFAMIIFCIAGLVFFSLFPMVKLEDGNAHLNDAGVDIFSVFAGMNDIDDDMTWMKFFLWSGLVTSLIALLGIAYSYYSLNDDSRGFHFTAVIGSLGILFGALFLVVHAILFSHIDDGGGSGFYTIDLSFAWNYIPLLCGICLVIYSSLFAKTALPVSLGKLGTGVIAPGQQPGQVMQQYPQQQAGYQQYPQQQGYQQFPQQQGYQQYPQQPGYQQSPQKPGYQQSPQQQTVPPETSQYICPTCGQPVRYVQEYDSYWCDQCHDYL